MGVAQSFIDGVTQGLVFFSYLKVPCCVPFFEPQPNRARAPFVQRPFASHVLPPPPPFFLHDPWPSPNRDREVEVHGVLQQRHGRVALGAAAAAPPAAAEPAAGPQSLRPGHRHLPRRPGWTQRVRRILGEPPKLFLRLSCWLPKATKRGT